MKAKNTVITNVEIIKRAREEIKNLTLMDDIYMSEVLQHKDAVELVLNIILNRTDLTVEWCNPETIVSNVYARSIRLDILAEDSEGKRYDIEVQNIEPNEKSVAQLLKRLRFYCGLIDVNCLPKGKHTKELPETYVIFILSNDIFEQNKPIYHMKKVIEETNETVDDGMNVLLVNSEIQDETPLGKLMEDFHRKEPNGMNYELLDKYNKL